MILKFKETEFEYLKNIKEVQDVNEKDFLLTKDIIEVNKVDFDIFYNDLLEHLFLFQKTLKNFSIIDGDYKIFYTKFNYDDEWNITIFKNTEQIFDDELLNKYKMHLNSLEIFRTHLNKTVFINKNPHIDFDFLDKKLSKKIISLYGKEFDKIIPILFAIKYDYKYICVDFNSPTFYNNNKIFNYEDFSKFIFENTPFFHKFKNLETIVKEQILEELLEIPLNSLKKYSSIFESKINMPGLYFYKFLIEYLRTLNDGSIPKKVLKKRGRKSKKELEAMKNKENNEDNDDNDEDFDNDED